VAGTIIADVIQSDQSYPSSINIASPIQISNTITGNVNIDSGTLFVDSVNNRVGVNTQNPSVGLDVRSSSSYLTNSTNPTSWVATSTALANSMYTQMNTDSNEGRIGTYSNHNLSLLTNNSTRVTLDTNGRIGVGHSGPFVGQIDRTRGTNGVRLDGIAASAIHFAGGRSVGGSASTLGTMFTVNFNAVTYITGSIHLFTNVHRLNGGGTSSTLGTYHIINFVSDDGGSSHNINTITSQGLTKGVAAPSFSVTGSISSKILTISGDSTVAGQAGYTFTGYFVYGGQSITPSNIILTVNDGPFTSSWGA